MVTKANTVDLAQYVAKTDLIAETQLDQAVRDKLNAVTGGTGYDDTEITTRVNTLESSITSIQTEVDAKADTSALDSYRLTAIKIIEADLDQAVIDKLNSSAYVHPVSRSA